jgi:transposase-like protein/ribosomal protein L37AE/L43A
MEEFPRTIMEFEKKFATKDACRDYLFKIRWPDGFRCPSCQGEKAWLTGNKLYHCANCGHQTAVTAGTIFQDTKKPLLLWFRAIWYATNQKQGVSALGLQHALDFGSYRTAWKWLHKLRYAMVRPGRDRLSGVVEVDETYIGGQRKGKRGRGAGRKALVVVIAQIDGPRIGRIRLQRVQDASGESLEAIGKAVEPGSVVYTDGWNGYSGLNAAGYVHEIVRKESEVGENLLPRCNRVASLLKRWLPGTHQGAVQTSHLDYYLDEFTFRFNRRTSKSRMKLFFRLVQQAVALGPVPEKGFKG